MMPIDPYKIVSEHQIMTDPLLWPEFCVGRNRDNIMACALQSLLSANKNKTVKDHQTLTLNIQGVDNLHSVIKRNLKPLIIMLPVSLVCQLKAIQPPNIPMCLKRFYANRISMTMKLT